MPVPAMSVLNGVCANSFNRHTSFLWDVCLRVCVCVAAMFFLSEGMKHADWSGKVWKKKF